MALWEILLCELDKLQISHRLITTKFNCICPLWLLWKWWMHWNKWTEISWKQRT